MTSLCFPGQCIHFKMGSAIKRVTMFFLTNVFTALEENILDFNFASMQLVLCRVVAVKRLAVHKVHQPSCTDYASFFTFEIKAYTIELQWLEQCWLVYHGCFELVLESLGKKSNNCRFWDNLWLFSFLY